MRREKMDDLILTAWLIGSMIAAGVAFIPANIAKKKGYSFGLWWLYGWGLLIVALIHVQFIPDKNESSQQNLDNNTTTTYTSNYSGQSVVDELKKYKELFDQGVITENEFQAKKEQLLKLI